MQYLIQLLIFLAIVLACITLASINRRLKQISRQLERSNNLAPKDSAELLTEMHVLTSAMSEVSRSIDQANTGQDVFIGRN